MSLSNNYSIYSLKYDCINIVERNISTKLSDCFVCVINSTFNKLFCRLLRSKYVLLTNYFGNLMFYRCIVCYAE